MGLSVAPSYETVVELTKGYSDGSEQYGHDDQTQAAMVPFQPLNMKYASILSITLPEIAGQAIKTPDPAPMPKPPYRRPYHSAEEAQEIEDSRAEDAERVELEDDENTDEEMDDDLRAATILSFDQERVEMAKRRSNEEQNIDIAKALSLANDMTIIDPAEAGPSRSRGLPQHAAAPLSSPMSESVVNESHIELPVPDGDRAVETRPQNTADSGADEKSAANSETPDKNTANAEVPEKNTANAEVPDKNTANAEAPDKNPANAEVPDKNTANAEVPDKNTANVNASDTIPAIATIAATPSSNAPTETEAASSPSRSLASVSGGPWNISATRTAPVGEHYHGNDTAYLSESHLIKSVASKVPAPDETDEGFFLGCHPVIKSRPESTTSKPAKSRTAVDRFDTAEQRNTIASTGPDPLTALVKGVPSVKVMVCHGSEQDYHSYIAVDIGFEWTMEQDGMPLPDSYSTHVELRFDARNLSRMPYITEVADDTSLPGPFKDVDAAFINTDFIKQGSCRYLVLHYKPGEVYASNALGDADFGPHNAIMEKLRRFVTHGGVFHLLCSPASALTDEIARVTERMVPEAIRSPWTKLWVLKGKGNNQYVKVMSDNVVPRDQPDVWRSRKATVSFRDRTELFACHMAGLVQHQAWQVTRAEDWIQCTARFCQFSGDPTTAAIMFIDIPTDLEHPWEKDESVYVDIKALNPKGTQESWWTATVMQSNVIRVRPEWGMMFALRPFRTLPANLKPLTELGEFPSLLNANDYDELEEQVSNAPVTKVAVYRSDPNDRAYRRQRMTLGAVANLISFERKHDNGVSVTDMLLRANRFDLLPDIDVLEGMTEAAKAELNPHTEFDLRKLTHAPAGMVLVEGCAGSGKTTFLGRLLAGIAIVRRGKDLPLQALVTTPSNVHADALVKRLGHFLRQTDPSAIVVRHYTKGAHRQTLERGVDAATQTLTLNAQDVISAINSQNPTTIRTIGRMYLNELEKSSAATIIDDRRVTWTLLHSTPIYVAIGTDIAKHDPAHHRGELVTRLQRMFPDDLKKNLRDAIQRAQIARENAATEDETGEDDEGSAEQNEKRESETALGEFIKQAFAIFYKAVDIVVATNQQAQDASLFDFISPYIYACDEAGKCDAVDSLAFVKYQGCHRRVLLGDTRQARPQVRSPSTMNGMAAQLGFALFSRLIASGFPVVQLHVQHRYSPEICNFVSGAFYNGRLQTGENMMNHPATATVAGTFKRLFGVEGNILLLDVPGSVEGTSPGTKSKINAQTADVTYETAIRIKEALSHMSVGIVTPYLGQNASYVTAAAMQASTTSLKAGRSSNMLSMIETFERSIGAQVDIAVADLVSAQKAGFIAETTRVNTGLTRCRYGLIIVADWHALLKPGKKVNRALASTPLGKGLNYLKRIDRVVRARQPKTTLQQLSTSRVIPNAEWGSSDHVDAPSAINGINAGEEKGTEEMARGDMAVGGAGDGEHAKDSTLMPFTPTEETPQAWEPDTTESTGYGGPPIQWKSEW